ncbi:hypothetical protein HD806DRAFT_197211 [Xylariaceae sp. AK1471]|nr:hypothetical protein HD806DRAFT_197211 [Xylariaceae sp. AK1471]
MHKLKRKGLLSRWNNNNNNLLNISFRLVVHTILAPGWSLQLKTRQGLGYLASTNYTCTVVVTFYHLSIYIGSSSTFRLLVAFVPLLRHHHHPSFSLSPTSPTSPDAIESPVTTLSAATAAAAAGAGLPLLPRLEVVLKIYMFPEYRTSSPVSSLPVAAQLRESDVEPLNPRVSQFHLRLNISLSLLKRWLSLSSNNHQCCPRLFSSSAFHDVFGPARSVVLIVDNRSLEA